MKETKAPKPKKRKKQSYIVNVDITIEAFTKIEAIQNISNMLSLFKLTFWIGSVLDEKQQQKALKYK